MSVTNDPLDQFEKRYSVALPSSMREYFQVANGTSDMANDYYQFWALKDVKLVREELVDSCHTDRLDYPHCFIFADYLLWCWAYAVELSADAELGGSVYILDGNKKRIIASSFLDFMQRYAINPDDMITI